MKSLFIALMILLMMFGIGGCAAGPNEMVDSPNEEGKVSGFWQGLWHGIVSPIAFVISLFSDTVHVYEIHNNGGWYNFGFLLGASIIFGGSGGGAASRRRRR
ncbi:MAG: hypothetical protein GTO14_08590 [Anaerolineales bacterium]|nr:hypothetical protein [Anaerolineales bacterium]